jgi:hypothetical protein
MTIDAAAIRLTDTILRDDGPDLEQTLKAIAANLGVLHISYAPLCSRKSEDANLLRAICNVPGRVASALFQETIRPNRSGHRSWKRGSSALRLG